MSRLHQEIASYKEHCTWRPSADTIVAPTPFPPGTSSAASQPEKSFNAQIPVSPNLYEIPIKQTYYGEGLQEQQQQQQQTLKVPANKSFKSGSIINSVENFQLIPKPLSLNDPLAKPPTLSSERKTSEAGSAADKMNVAPNAPMPEPMRASTSTQANSKRSDDMGVVKKHPKQLTLPNGVVPFDDISDKAHDPTNEIDADKAGNNNRYQNVINDIGATGEKSQLNELQNGNGDKDNGAREENDSDFVVDGNHRGHVGEQKADPMIRNNAAEDLNLYENGNENRANGAKVEKPADGNDGDGDLQVIHQSDNDNNGIHNQSNDDDVKLQAKRDQGEAYPDDPDDRLRELAEDGGDGKWGIWEIGRLALHRIQF